jgi:parvulin-like peptidyl-prolyl isomerase
VLLASGLRGDILERVVARVNGDTVTLTEFRNRQLAAVQQARLTPDRVPIYLRENNARLLQEAVDELLLAQRAAELGIRLRPEYVTDVIDNIKKENSLANEDELKEQLLREGMTLADLKRNIERSILRRQVLARELEPRSVVSEAEVTAAYEERRADYSRPEQVKLQEILLKGPEAEAQAADLAARARAGEDFAELARTHSEAATRATAGDLGTLSPAELSPELKSAATTLAAGGVSDPIRCRDGVRILRLVERTPAGVTPLDDVKAAIRERLAQDKWTTEYQRYVEGLRKGASVDVKVREVPLELSSPAGAMAPLGARPAPTAPPIAVPSPTPSPAASGEAEIETTPQDRPERVAPAPRPEPSPSPTPPGGGPAGD